MDPLFNRVDIFSVIEHQKQKLKDAFETVTNADLDADPIAVASRLIEQCSITVPVLDEEKKYALTKETQVDVAGFGVVSGKSKAPPCRKERGEDGAPGSHGC